LGCGQSASQNTTYFEASGASAGICSAKICKSSSNICQVQKSMEINYIANVNLNALKKLNNRKKSNFKAAKIFGIGVLRVVL
jgi:hypothetical protein